MKEIKLHNVIFPIWMLLFFPPVIFISLLGNFIIDSLVIAICFYAYKLISTQDVFIVFYKKSIVKVWLFGFLADFVGGAILFALNIFDESLGLPNELIQGINYDPFRCPIGALVILFTMVISSALIFIFNYKFTFKEQIKEKKLRFKVAITIAVVTTPWTFLLPTKWFYNGL